MKKLILSLALLSGALSTYAQQMDTVVVANDDKYTVETNRFHQNWFIQAGGGVQVLFADHTKQMELLDRLSPAVDVAFGKWFTPGIGVRAGVLGYQLNGVSGWSNHAYDHPNINWNHYLGYIKNPKLDASGKHYIGEVYSSKNGYPLYKTDMKFINGHIDVMFNLSNMLFGYDNERIYSFIPYGGLGFALSIGDKAIRLQKDNSYAQNGRTHEATVNVGLFNKFRITDRFDLFLDVRGTYAGDNFDQQQGGRYGEGILSAMIGASIDLGKNHWDRSTTTTIKFDENYLDALRNRIAELEAANNTLQSDLDAASKEEVKKQVIAGPLLVTFVINRTELRNKDKVNLTFLAENLKQIPDAKILVSGFADAGTGNKSINERLSEGRAQVVYDFLVNECGVNPNQIVKEHKGGVENMYYDDPRCSRAVITKLID